MIRKLLEKRKLKKYAEKQVRDLGSQINPDEFANTLEDGNRLVKLEEYEAVLNLVEKVREKSLLENQHEQLTLLYSQGLAGTGKLGEALHALDLLLSKNPNLELAKYYKIVFTLRGSDLDRKLFELEEDFKDAKKEANRHSFLSLGKHKAAYEEYKLLKNRIKFEKKNLVPLLELLRSLLKQNSEHKLDYLFYLGVVAYLLDKVNESVQCFERLLAADPEYVNDNIKFTFFDQVKLKL